MSKRLAVMAFLLLAVLVSTGAHANGFFFLWQRTNITTESSPVITVMANIFDCNSRSKDVWTIDQPTLKDIAFGDTFELVLAASAKSIVGTDKKADEFLRKYGVKTEWYRPADVGGVPYRYDKTAQAEEFNRVHRIMASDPTDGDSPAKVDFRPADVLNQGTYVVGANIKTVWLRIVNGSRLAKELEFLGLFRYTTVSHDDVWIPIQVEFTATPAPKVDRKTETDREDRMAIVTRNVNNIRAIIADLQTRDSAIWEAYCAGQRVQDARIAAIEKCLEEIRGAIGDLKAGDQVLLGLINELRKTDAAQDARLDRLEQRWTEASNGSVVTSYCNQTVHFRIAFVCGNGQSMRATSSLAGLPLTATEMECTSGLGSFPRGVVEYENNGLATGTSMNFRVRRPQGQWQTVNFTVTEALEGKVMVIPVQ